MKTHQITFGGSKQQPVTFEVPNGLEVMNRLKMDAQAMGAKIIQCDNYGFCASLNGHNIAYTMIDI